VDGFIGELLLLEHYAKGVQLLIDKKAMKAVFDPRLAG